MADKGGAGPVSGEGERVIDESDEEERQDEETRHKGVRRKEVYRMEMR